jgi:adenosine/AMP kinase
MKWTNKPENVLLERSFLFGIVGIILGTLAMVNTKFHLLDAPMGPLNGVSFALQLLAISLAILVLRKRKVDPDLKQKAQKMIVVLGAAFLFFVLSL